MAGEIAIHLATGLANTTAEIIPPDANYGWDGSQAVLWENLTLAQWQGGLVTITEAVLATGERTGLYKGDFPAASTLGKFGIRVRNTPSPTPASEVIAIGTIDWNGSREAAFPPNLEKLGITSSGVLVAGESVLAIREGLSTFNPSQHGVMLTAQQPAYAPAKAGDPMALTAEERGAVATAMLDLADGIEANITLRDAIRIIAAAVAGLLSGAGTDTERFKGLDKVTTRLTVRADEKGNRTEITYHK